MRKGKLGRRILSVVMSVATAACVWTAPKIVVEAETSAQGQLPMRVLSADEMVAEMGAGWNLGNTMDGHTGFTPNETLWQNVETTQMLIDAVHDYGFNTVRVPVTWGTMIDDENGYAINDKWMSRVQDIVDYCVSQDMYVIVNIHHDGAEQSGWLRVGAEDQGPVQEKFAAVWKQIAERFKDYDEHVIFESMNEVVGPSDSMDGIILDTQRIMDLNQIFVDTVRATGSNNAERWLSVPGRYTNIENSTKEEVGFDIPKDTVDNRLFVAVHYYDWTFGMLENMNLTTWGLQSAEALQRDFVKLYDKFTSKGIPVIMGEYGCINKNNPADRAYHVEVVNRLGQMYGVVPVYWDQGWYDRTVDPADFSYTLIDRNTGETIDKEVTDAIMRGLFISGSDDLTDIALSPEIVSITDVTYSVSDITLAVGQNVKINATVAPENTNDVLLWSTDDTDVATVYNGFVRAKGIGVTTIHAYSQSGSYAKDFTVVVLPQSCEAPCTEITGLKDSYAVETEKYIFLNAGMAPENTDAYLTYQSSNEAVATVSSTGKVVGKSVGVTYITVTASTGLSKTVKVSVSAPVLDASIRLALNVYYNDEALSYFSNEVGEPITVTGEGQYTVKFNCETDLSQTARDLGVSGLLNLTAIYIKDQDVTEGLAKKSPLASCDIMFDEIYVNDTKMTITQEAPKSALKASGIFDTNDPFNSWDGSQVKEVQVSNHVLNIGCPTTPTEVTVTFTLSNMVFVEADATASQSIEVESLKTETKDITVTAGETQDITVQVTPTDAAAPITFAAADASVASVDSTAVISDATSGEATISVYGVNAGSTTVTAYAENGKTVKINVTVEGEAVVVPDEPEVPAQPEEPVTPSEPETPADEPANTPDADEPVTEVNTDDNEAPKKGLSTVAIVAIVIGVVVVLGTVVYVVVSLKPAKGAKKEEPKAEEAKEE